MHDNLPVVSVMPGESQNKVRTKCEDFSNPCLNFLFQGGHAFLLTTFCALYLFKSKIQKPADDIELKVADD